MRFIANTNDFVQALRKVMLASNSKISDIPALSCIKFEVGHDGLLKMTAYNMTVAIETIVRAEDYKEGSICIPSKILSDIVFKCNSDTVSISADEETYKCEIKCGRAKFQSQGIDSETFPKLPDAGETKTVDADGDDLIDAASTALYAVATDERKPIMQGVCFQFKNGIVDVVGCDSYRLAHTALKANSDREFQITVPSETVSMFQRLFKDTDEQAKITYSRNFIVVKFGETKITSRLLSGQYFEWEKAIPHNASVYCEFDKKKLSDSINIAIACQANVKGAGAPIVFYLTPNSNEVKIGLKSNTGEFEDELDMETNGALNFKIAFNPKYLLDAMRHIDSEKIRFYIQGALSPVIVKAQDAQDDFHMVLPVRVK